MVHPEVSVIIPCYNVESAVGNCIQSVLNQSFPQDQYEIIIVDDGSEDGTLGEINKFQEVSNVTVHAHPENRGLSASRNTGIRLSGGTILCFLDSDMTVGKNWIETFLLELSDSSVVGVVGNVMLPKGEKGNKLDKYFYSPKRGARQFGENTPIGFQWFLFNNAAIQREKLDKVGVFDESIKTYGGEDTELAIRIWDEYPNGFRYSAVAVSEHHHQRTLEEFCLGMEIYGKNNLPLLLNRFPQYKSELGGDWIDSAQGYMIFNPVFAIIVFIISRLFPVFFLIRYCVVYSVVKGARKSLK